MKRNKNEGHEYWDESTHTILSYSFLVLAIGIEMGIGISYITTIVGQLCILESVFGVFGLLFLDWMHLKKFSIYPRRYKRIHSNLFFRFAITFVIIAVIQFAFQIIPLITSTEMAMAIVFCAVCEEYFFRGVFLEPFFIAGKKASPDFKITIWKYAPEKNKPDKEISYIELFGILLSAILFAAFHVNYYYDWRLIGMVFVGGLWFGFVYFWNKDITAVILAHFLLNIIFVAQFYQIFF